MENTVSSEKLKRLYDSYEIVGAYRLICAVFGEKPSMESFGRWAQLYSPSVSEVLHNVLETLTAREQGILTVYYGLTGDGQSLQTTGDPFGLTRQRISQIKIKAMQKMWHPARLRRLEHLKGVFTKV